MKKKILIISIITLLVIVLVVTLLLIFMNKDDSSQLSDQKEGLPVNIEEVHDHEDENNELIEETTEIDHENNLSNETIEETEDNVPNSSDQTSEGKNNSNQQNNNNQNVSIPNEPVEEPQEPEEVIEKNVCANDNPGYQSFLADYKSNHPTYFVFNSESDAITFGERAMTEFGYMYQRNTLPVEYKGDCYKEIWYVRLTITARACTKDGVYNDVIHIPATSMDLVSIHDYLRSLGYDCGNKV